jgi:hypothetical protein
LRQLVQLAYLAATAARFYRFGSRTVSLGSPHRFSARSSDEFLTTTLVSTPHFVTYLSHRYTWFVLTNNSCLASRVPSFHPSYLARAKNILLKRRPQPRPARSANLRLRTINSCRTPDTFVTRLVQQRTAAAQPSKIGIADQELSVRQLLHGHGERHLPNDCTIALGTPKLTRRRLRRDDLKVLFDQPQRRRQATPNQKLAHRQLSPDPLFRASTRRCRLEAEGRVCMKAILQRGPAHRSFRASGRSDL